MGNPGIPTIVKAPGVIKLLGEHAVVYGRLAVAVGINMYAEARVSSSTHPGVTIDVPDFKASGTLTEDELNRLYKAYTSKKSIDEYISEQKMPSPYLLPFATIAARLLNEFGVNLLGTKVDLSSAIPLQKGLASSAALSTAFAVALVAHCGAEVSDDGIVDVSRDGDRIMHRNANAGRIDVSTTFYGGYTTFSSAAGAKKEAVDTKLDMLIIDTGPKKPTAETVGHVEKLYGQDKKGITTILDKINEQSERGLDSARKGDLEGLGRYMYEDQLLLEKLGVSSDRLDNAVEIAMGSGAYGAKLSGGGGGGIAVALVRRNDRALISKLEAQGFGVMEAAISFEGAKDYLHHRDI